MLLVLMNTLAAWRTAWPRWAGSQSALSCRRSREVLGARVSGSRAPRVGGVGQRTTRGAASPLCLVGRARGCRIDSRSPQVGARSRRRRRLASRTSRSARRGSSDRDLAIVEDAAEHAAGLAAVGGVGVIKRAPDAAVGLGFHFERLPQSPAAWQRWRHDRDTEPEDAGVGAEIGDWRSSSSSVVTA